MAHPKSLPTDDKLLLIHYATLDPKTLLADELRDYCKLLYSAHFEAHQLYLQRNKIHAIPIYKPVSI